MAGVFESFFWLVTGKDWEQTKENLKCDLAVCDHDHTTVTKQEESKDKDKE